MKKLKSAVRPLTIRIGVEQLDKLDQLLLDVRKQSGVKITVTAAVRHAIDYLLSLNLNCGEIKSGKDLFKETAK